ncbi:MAG: glutamine-hydrolyzing GMP synthase, partial [Chloroflexota bacterium]
MSVSGDVEVGTYLEIAEAEAMASETTVSDAPVVPQAPTARDAVAILDYGSQYSQLIARRVREANVYCELLPHDVTPERFAELNPRGVILSGGPASVYEPGAPRLPEFVLESGLPILGICYGMQLLAHQLGGTVAPSSKREYGPANLHRATGDGGIFYGLPDSFGVWMSHGDKVTEAPPGFEVIARSDNSDFAAMADSQGRIGIQFHPEVVHTPLGKDVIRNFLYRVCGCEPTWTPGSYIDRAVNDIRTQVGDGRVICALSGGVDSAVAASLIHEAIGDQLVCVFVNNGLMRREEPERTVATFGKHLKFNLIAVDAVDRFLGQLNGVTDPEEKRKIVGGEFIRVFAEEARKLGTIDFLAQGT